MTVGSDTRFDRRPVHERSELTNAALSAVSHPGGDGTGSSLVIVIHPSSDDRRVLAAPAASVLRAAISVVAAAGNERMWAEMPVGDTVERAVNSLPEVVRAAADAHAVTTTHTGLVEHGDDIVVAIWFDTATGTSRIDDRRHVLHLLATAVDREHDGAPSRPLAVGAPDHGGAAPTAAGPAIPADLQDDERDPLTGVANRRRFDRQLGRCDPDHTALITVDVEHLPQLHQLYGPDAAADVLAVVADRILSACRTNDLVARIDDGRFAVLVDDVDGSIAAHISQRIVTAVAAPLPPGRSAANLMPLTVSAAVSMAHGFDGSGETDRATVAEPASDHGLHPSGLAMRQ